jgi:hypothetical protein
MCCGDPACGLLALQTAHQRTERHESHHHRAAYGSNRHHQFVHALATFYLWQLGNYAAFAHEAFSLKLTVTTVFCAAPAQVRQMAACSLPPPARVSLKSVVFLNIK